tara:strand:- start:861 stop:1550 length:690 start_codon:yes stop_codon:yes gene_type:complete
MIIIKTGDKNLKNISSFVNDVKENGYFKIEEFVTADEASELEALSLNAFNKAEESQYHIKEEHTAVLSIKEEDTINKSYLNFLNQYFTDSNLIEFVENYFESKNIEIPKIFLAESSSTGQKVDVLPYKMHFDKTRYLKFMIYLRDVGKGDGGTTFAKKEWNTKLQKELLSRDALKEENVVEVYDMNAVEEITGQAGTCTVFDTNITHKAGQVLNKNKRLVLRIDTRSKE